MCGSDRAGSSEDSDCDDEDESSMMNWVIPPAHPQVPTAPLSTQLSKPAVPPPAAPPDGVTLQLSPSAVANSVAGKQTNNTLPQKLAATSAVSAAATKVSAEAAAAATAASENVKTGTSASAATAEAVASQAAGVAPAVPEAAADTEPASTQGNDFSFFQTIQLFFILK